MQFAKVAFTLLATAFVVIGADGECWGLPSEVMTFDGESLDDQFSISVSTAGDFNGDGLDEILVGASGSDSGGVSSGKAYVYEGGDTSGTAFLEVTGVAGEFLGSAAAGGGDIDGDGYDDIILGAPRFSGSVSNGGRILVFYGDSLADATPGMVIKGQFAEGRMGDAVAIAGRFNGDQYADFLVASPREGNGKVRVYLGSDSPDSIPDMVLNGMSSSERFGHALSTGDINGDTFDDVIVGAPRNSDCSFWSGRVYVYFGGVAPDTSPDLTICGPTPGEQFGHSVWLADDINGDHYGDLVVGSPYWNSMTLLDAGVVRVYQGGSAPDTTVDHVLSGTSTEGLFGFSVSGGNTDGDGFSEIIVGEPRSDLPGADAGATYLFLGSTVFDTIPDQECHGENAGDQFGYSVATTGFTGFGGADNLVVGAWSHNDIGRAYVFADTSAVSSISAADTAPVRLLNTFYPNPFRTSCSLKANAAEKSVIMVYDAKGRLVRTLNETGGFYSWDGRDRDGTRLPCGLYFWKAMGEVKHSGKILLVR